MYVTTRRTFPRCNRPVSGAMVATVAVALGFVVLGPVAVSGLILRVNHLKTGPIFGTGRTSTTTSRWHWAASDNALSGLPFTTHGIVDGVNSCSSSGRSLFNCKGWTGQLLSGWWVQETRQRRKTRQEGFVRMGVYNPNDELRAIVQRKQYEVQALLKQHVAEDDRLQMRLKYGASKGRYDLRLALRRNKGMEEDHMTLVVADLKRRSPTSLELPPDVTIYDDAAEWASQVYDAGARVLMVNTDGPAWGGSMSDLDAVVAHFKKRDTPPPPIIMKDVIVHPIQMAQALEKGAAGTVLIACVLGPALRDMMDVATTMGTECIVEVHTPAECEKALEHGPCVLMVNNWDRITGKLYPRQAMAVRRLIPDEILTIAAGGITTREQAAELSDEGYDAVVLGRSLVAGGGGANGGDSGPELIRGVSGRVGVPRSMLGWGIKAEELHMKDSR